MITTTATALKVMPVAAKHPTQLYASGSLAILALGALAVSYAAIATLARNRGAAVATVAALIGGNRCLLRGHRRGPGLSQPGRRCDGTPVTGRGRAIPDDNLQFRVRPRVLLRLFHRHLRRAGPQFHRAITESLAEWWRQQGGHFAAVTVIGKESSARVHELRDLLARNNVPFGFHRSDSKDGSAALQRLGLEQSSGPVVTLYTGVVLTDPANAEVAEALGMNIRPADTTYDVVIVGAGPAGLAAAVYGASEGLRTALLEREAFGGQAGTTSLIRNYLGFPRGVSGAELAGRAYEQAWMFGTQFVYGNPATSLAIDGDLRIVGLQDGSAVTSRAVVIATGVSYRRLAVPELEPLAGAGVFYGAATTESQALAGKQAFVVGGGNSAGQAALHLSKYAQHVTILVRSKSLAASMSQYLIREIETAPNIEVCYRTEVTGGGGDGRLEQLSLRHRDTGDTRTEPADGLFVLIGAQPLTEWLPEAVGRDQWGYILTGPDLAERWTLQREPYLLETSTPGVFAVGDVRHASVKRVAAAVGDGSIAIRLAHDYLA